MPRLNMMRVFAATVAIAVLGSCGGGGNSGPAPLSITADSPPEGTTGTGYSGYTFVATGGTPPLRWSESGRLPPGLALSTSGQVSGTPATAGTYPISVTVTDSSVPPLMTRAPVSLKVSDSTITVAAASPPAGTVSYAYLGFMFSANGGSPPYAWAATGTLPPGLTLGTDGSLSGTPTQAGTFSFSVTPTDSAQTPVKGPALSVPITINDPTSLVLNAAPAPPTGVDGAAYGPFNFGVTGGFQPLHWSITGGSLPAGLTLGANDGSLSGIPSSLGTSNFTVTVTDSGPRPAQSALPFSVTINATSPPTIVYSEPPTATVGMAYGPFQFTANGGLAPLAWSESGAQLPDLTLSTSGALSGTPNKAGQFPISLEVKDAFNQAAPKVPVVIRVSLPHSGSFTTLAAHLIVPRSGHAATLLNNGKVLITGGANGVADTSAELYDPATGTFTPTAGAMTEPRINHTATLLSDSSLANYGKVLIAGSADTTAELYDPATETFKATGSMHHPRTSPTGTLLSNGGPNAGKVLMVGGNTASGDLVAELYDPATGAFSDTGSTTIVRTGHTATLLTAGALAGQVLIAGGDGTATAELYNPATGRFTATGSMTGGLGWHTATALGPQDGAQNGDALIVGIDGSTDLFNPGTAEFTAVGSVNPPYPIGIASHTASLRTDGTVVVAGGNVVIPTYKANFCRGLPWQCYCVVRGYLPRSTPAAALFAPESAGFTPTAALNTSRDGHTATVLVDGAVLVVGGTQHTLGFSSKSHCTTQGPAYSATILSSAELFR